MVPTTRSRTCQACGQPSAITNEETSDSSVHQNVLCSDCLLAVDMVAEEEDFDNDDAKSDDVISDTVHETVTSIYLAFSPKQKLDEKFRQSLAQGSGENNVVLQLQVKTQRDQSSQGLLYYELLDVQNHRPEGTMEPTHVVTPEHRTAGATRYGATVSPYNKKRDASLVSKKCEDCNKQTVPEEWMQYCKRCYAKRCRKLEEEAGVSNSPTKVASPPGKCRLCTGAVSDPEYEYCLKCYLAKQRDDARRAEKQVLENAKRPKVAPLRVPFVCVTCGGAIHDCSWKTQCPSCYRSNPEPKRPRLLRKPKRVLWT